VFGAYYQSGQSCIGVQWIMVHDSLYDEFKARFTAKMSQLIMGDPKAEDTFIGPMISESEACRLDDWINEAKDMGATLLVGGERVGNMLPASLLENVSSDAKLNTEEAFGPVAILSKFSDFDGIVIGDVPS
jgi:acyl-CoA reductase-like NAD-dependent aldehyde dehydrogenase